MCLVAVSDELKKNTITAYAFVARNARWPTHSNCAANYNILISKCPDVFTLSRTPSRTEPDVKRIGVIGGLSPESTVHYYQILFREYNRQIGQLNFPEITIESLNLQTLVRLFEVNDWDGVAAILLDALARLQRAGADFAAILANSNPPFTKTLFRWPLRRRIFVTSICRRSEACTSGG